MRKMQNNIIELHTVCKMLVEEVNRQDYLACKNLIKNSREMLMEIIEGFVSKIYIYKEYGCSITVEYITNMLVGLEEAQKKEDYILYADLVELQLIPTLNDFQNIVREYLEYSIDESVFANNIDALKNSTSQSLKKLYSQIIDYIEVRESNKDLECNLEPTSSGSNTLHVTSGSIDYYLHSNNNPIFEAKAIANRYYSKDDNKYVVVGMALGYHIIELLKLNKYMEIIVFESKLEVIYQALCESDLRQLFSNSNVSIICDSQLLGLREYISNDYVRLIIHRASIKYIENKQLASKLEIILEQQDYIKRSDNKFFLNVMSNIKNCNSYVDELQEQIKGKKVVIVAAGPSLDKNIHLLKNKPEDVIVIATGTVFLKMINMGIRPDFVIISDVNAYCQVVELEDETIPMLLLSTADREIGMNYKGKKYLICQREMEEANKYAQANQFNTYETGGSVSTTALDVVIGLGAKEIAFIGLDLSFSNNRAHASGTLEVDIYELDYMVKVESIEGEMLNTSKVFNKYRNWIERRLKKNDYKCKVYDATEGGAKIEGMSIITLKEFLAKAE